MSAEQDVKVGKPKKNLSLSEETIAQGLDLQQALKRPSLTNLVEALIDAEHKRHFTAEQPQAAQPVQEAA